MSIKGKHHTTCTVCGRQVAAVVNWEKRQAGHLVGEYRVTRHAAEPRRTSHRPERRTMCPGGGILVNARDVSAADGGTLPARSPGQSHGG